MNGRAKLDEYVTHTMPLQDINRAFDLMHEGESIRSVVRYGSDLYAQIPAGDSGAADLNATAHE
jgi:hypothetical protein